MEHWPHNNSTDFLPPFFFFEAILRHKHCVPRVLAPDTLAFTWEGGRKTIFNVQGFKTYTVSVPFLKNSIG